MSVKISSSAVAVDQEYFWQPMSSCPAGVKVQLLGRGGVACYSAFTKDDWWVGWAPLPRKPDWMK